MRKTALAFSLLLLTLTAGCHAQQPVVPLNSCPAVTGTVYQALNLAAPVTALTYTDSSVTTGSWCYMVQSEINTQTPAAMSGPSNVAGPVNVLAGYLVNVTWNAPTTGPAPTGYVISRAAAVQTFLTAPAAVSGTSTVN